jgi:peptidoglycan-N-acetylmuramic acid deacetylase
MLHVNDHSVSRRALICGVLLGLACFSSAEVVAQVAAAKAQAPCERPVYLTIDTGHMGVAPLIVDVLARQQVHATFFLANERTQAVGERAEGSTLDAQWAFWWKTLAAQGHDFGSHTWDHVIWKADSQGGFRMKATSGPQTGSMLQLTAAQYCEELAEPARRFRQMTGQPMRALFRAPGGKTSPALIAAAKSCGWTHVGWSDAGFLGDELPSESYPNRALLDRALQRIHPGDILMMHLGIWSRKEPWAPAVLEPLIVGLKAKGLCFATLREHPDYVAVVPAP